MCSYCTTERFFVMLSTQSIQLSPPGAHLQRGSRPSWLSTEALEPAACIRSSSATHPLLNLNHLSGPICKIGDYNDQAQVSKITVVLVPQSGSLNAGSLWHRDKQDRCACCLWLAARYSHHRQMSVMRATQKYMKEGAWTGLEECGKKGCCFMKKLVN